jgi:hypothetical protein
MRVHVVTTSETTRDYLYSLESRSSQGCPDPEYGAIAAEWIGSQPCGFHTSCWDLRTGTRTKILAVSFLSSACTFLSLVKFGIPQFLATSSARPLYDVLAGCVAACHFWRVALFTILVIGLLNDSASCSGSCRFHLGISFPPLSHYDFFSTIDKSPRLPQLMRMLTRIQHGWQRDLFNTPGPGGGTTNPRILG